MHDPPGGEGESVLGRAGFRAIWPEEEALRGRLEGRFPEGLVFSQLQPVVEPQVSHLRQVPFLTKVRWPQTGQGSPS